MKPVKVMYRQEPDGAWIATSDDVPGFVGHGDSYEEARDRVQEGLPWYVEDDLVIAHITPAGAGGLVEGASSGARVQLTQALTTEPAVHYHPVPLPTSG